MSTSSMKKIGFFAALSMMIGSVVGIGVFLKNGSISRATEGSGISWLLAWIIGGLISLAAAINFSEIGSFKNLKISGLSNWAFQTTKSNKFGYFVSSTWTLFYWGIFFTILSAFGSEMFFRFLVEINAIDPASIGVWVHFVVGAGISVLYITLNILSPKLSGRIQMVITVLKFLPIIVAVVVGLIMANTHNNENGTNAFIGSTLNKGVILALPAVLFAYDSFLVAGSLGNKIKNPSKTLPKVVIIGMITVVSLYTLLAISSILHNSGSVASLLTDSLPASVSKYISPIITFFIMISVLGVINGITGGFVAEIQNAMEAKTLFASEKLTSSLGKAKASLVYIAVIWVFWSLIVHLPAIIMNTDSMLDGASNYPTVFFFGIYGLVIALYTFKRRKITETKKLNDILYYSAAAFAITGIVVVEFAYVFAIFSDLWNENYKNSWGLYWDNGAPQFQSAVVPVVMYFSFLAGLFIIPTLNWGLEKLIFKRDIVRDFDKLVDLN